MKSHSEVVDALQSRWPEHRVGRGKQRIEALLDLLGSPEQSSPVIMVAGTNGKGSTAIMIESLLMALGLRVGRFSSPHLIDVTERISIDGEPIAAERFDELVAHTLPFVEIVDAQQIGGIAMTFFEVMVALAYSAFAESPVDVAVMEVGLGGEWDATNVVSAQVAVVTPIDVDHAHLLGDTAAEIAVEKAGIIRPGSVAVLAGQRDDVAPVLIARCAEVGARVFREGIEFGHLSRHLAVGGQVLRLNTASGPLGDVFLPLHGAHMAQNAALAVGAVEAFLGGRPLPADVIGDGLGSVMAPARLEVVRRSPTVLLDTCHNPHGTRATMTAVTEAFAFEPLIGVIGMMADKDVSGVVAELSEHVATFVCTQVGSTSRGLPATELGARASEIVGADRVEVVPDLIDAIERGVALADASGPTAGVLIAGSVILAGEARALLVRVKPEDQEDSQ